MIRRNSPLVERLIREAGSWPGVTVGDHRFGGTEFLVASREIGHVHGWGMLDVNFLRRLRDVLVDADLTGVHHLLTDSGWTTFMLRTEADYDRARWLLRLSYLYQVSVLQKRADGTEPYAAVDVAAELRKLDPPEAVRAAFERRSAPA
ncbi:luciferase family protein [Halobium salinum]|uniref:Luciferase family protein n=1 Tax=Halobium salinum TaxID=1364940 RepID=A0ABD5P8X0_9EURY|nr:luciferase family protein [Halobium salinum]